MKDNPHLMLAPASSLIAQINYSLKSILKGRTPKRAKTDGVKAAKELGVLAGRLEKAMANYPLDDPNVATPERSFAGPYKPPTRTESVVDRIEDFLEDR